MSNQFNNTHQAKFRHTQNFVNQYKQRDQNKKFECTAENFVGIDFVTYPIYKRQNTFEMNFNNY